MIDAFDFKAMTQLLATAPERGYVRRRFEAMAIDDMMSRAGRWLGERLRRSLDGERARRWRELVSGRRDSFRAWCERRGIAAISDERFAGATAAGLRIEIRLSSHPETNDSVTVSGVVRRLSSTSLVQRLTPLWRFFWESSMPDETPSAKQGTFAACSDDVEPGKLAALIENGPLGRVRSLREVVIQKDSVFIDPGIVTSAADWDALIDGAGAIIDWVNASDPSVTARRSAPESSSS